MDGQADHNEALFGLADIEGGNARGCGEGDIPMGYAAPPAVL